MRKFYGLSRSSQVTLQEYFHVGNLEPFQNVAVDDLYFSKRVKNLMLENNRKTVADVLGSTIEELYNIENLGKSGVRSVFLRVYRYFSSPKSLNSAMTADGILSEPIVSENKNLKEIAQEIILKACKTDKDIAVITWRAESKTFEKIGDYYGFTRERIRQIEAKILDTFKSSCLEQTEKFFGDLQEIIGERVFITSTELENLVGEKKARIILYFVWKVDWDKKFFSYDKNIRAAFFKNKNYPSAGYDELIEQLPTFMEADKFEEEVARLVEENHCDREFLDFKLSHVYQHTGNFYHKEPMNLFAKFAYVLKKFFPEGYRVAEPMYHKKFSQHMREIFGYNKRITPKSLDGNIGSYIGVLCDRGKYLHPDYVKVPIEIVDLIRAYIENSKRTAISYKEIYETLKKNFNGTQIENHYFVQGLIRMYKFPYIMRKDYLTKNPDVNMTKEFEWFVKSHEKVSAKDIKKYFRGFDNTNISLLVQRVPEVIGIGRNNYMHSSYLNLQEKDFVEIEKVLHEFCDNNTVNEKELFEPMMTRVEDFFERNEIDSPGKMFGILQYMFRDKFDFIRPNISAKASLRHTHKMILSEILSDTDIISIDEMEELCETENLNFTTTNAMILEIFPELIRADQFTMCRPEIAGITDEVIAAVRKFIKSVLAESEGWRAARVLENFDSLPKVNFEWNSFLLESAASLAGDIKILRNISVVPEHSQAVFVDEKIFPENDFDAFLLKVLLAEHKKNPFTSYERIMTWLRKKGLRRTYVPKFLIDGGHLYRDENKKLVLK